MAQTTEEEVQEIDWDDLEAAGHKFTMVHGFDLGQSKYICENCGAFIVIAGMGRPVLELWHHPHREDRKCEERRGTGPSLQTKMDQLHVRMVERLSDT
jgi:hypothetical protein